MPAMKRVTMPRSVSLPQVIGEVGKTGWLRSHAAQAASAGSMRALLAAVDAKDAYTRRHSEQVAQYAEEIARRMRISRSRLRGLRTAALMHDVGKIGVPDRILNKPGPLSEDEAEQMEKHPRIALSILSPMRLPHGVRAAVLHHHERYDGLGYPSGLLGEDIPIESRILAVADALDTMLSPRPYKDPFALEQVRSELLEQSGKQFDPYAAGITLGWLAEWDDPRAA